MLAGVANGFDAQRAMINVVRLIAGWSRQLIPQTAVVGLREEEVVVGFLEDGFREVGEVGFLEEGAGEADQSIVTNLSRSKKRRL
jgi:hypothetical protein